MFVSLKKSLLSSQAIYEYSAIMVYVLRVLGKKWTILATEGLAKVMTLWIRDTVEQIPALGGDGLADLKLCKSRQGMGVRPGEVVRSCHLRASLGKEAGVRVEAWSCRQGL